MGSRVITICDFCGLEKETNGNTIGDIFVRLCISATDNHKKRTFLHRDSLPGEPKGDGHAVSMSTNESIELLACEPCVKKFIPGFELRGNAYYAEQNRIEMEKAGIL